MFMKVLKAPIPSHPRASNQPRLTLTRWRLIHQAFPSPMTFSCLLSNRSHHGIILTIRKTMHLKKSWWYQIPWPVSGNPFHHKVFLFAILLEGSFPVSMGKGLSVMSVTKAVQAHFYQLFMTYIEWATRELGPGNMKIRGCSTQGSGRFRGITWWMALGDDMKLRRYKFERGRQLEMTC